MRAVLLGAARGETAAETAARLWVSANTVKTHRRRAFVRLGVSSAAQAVAAAMAAGQITAADVQGGEGR